MGKSEGHSIEYRFRLSGGPARCISLSLDSTTLELQGAAAAPLPDWTRLDFHQCPNCPLKPESQRHCPLSASLVDLVELCRELHSYEEVDVEVLTPERTVSARTTVQRAVSSVFGLLIATSGCPHTTYFRPMARFHLPLSSEEETIYRASSMYMLAQYFIARHGDMPDLGLKGLAEIYADIQVINDAMAERLRSLNTQDSAVNAIVLLDLFAKTMPGVIDDALEEMEYLFSPYLGSREGGGS